MYILVIDMLNIFMLIKVMLVIDMLVIDMLVIVLLVIRALWGQGQGDTVLKRSVPPPPYDRPPAQATSLFNSS